MTTQRTLFDPQSGLTPEARAVTALLLARIDHPATSHESAEQVVSGGIVSRHGRHVVDLLRVAEGSLTTHELADRSTLTNAQIHKRMAELARSKPGRAKLVERGETRICRCRGVDPQCARHHLQTWKISSGSGLDTQKREG